MRLLPFCLLPLLILMISCGSKDQYMGAYRAEIKDSPKQAETVLELRADGVGIWRVGGEEVPFSWYIKGGELRVNTKAGGVIVGAIDNDVIHIILPGSKKFSFKKFR
jgi:hypothetical protein